MKQQKIYNTVLNMNETTENIQSYTNNSIKHERNNRKYTIQY